MELVGTALQNHVDLGAAAASKFRGVIARLDFEFLNGIDGGKRDVLIDIRIVVVHALQQEVVGLFARAVHADGAALSGILRSLGGQLAARRQQRKRQEVPLVQRQLVHQASVDHLPQSGSVGLDNGRRIVDLNLFGYDAHLKCEIDTRGLVHIEAQIVEHGASKSVLFNGHAVVAWRKQGQGKISIVIAERFTSGVGGGVAHRDAGLRDDTPAGIRYRASDGTGGIVCQNRKNETTPQQRQA